MTEFSFPWGCTVAGDGGVNSFSLEIVEKMNRYLNNVNPDTDGVIRWTQSPFAGLLNATNPSGSIVRIASGIGMVEGWLYESDSNVDFDVSGGNANATDLIVLRRSNPGSLPQTVRLAHKRGPASGSATVTQTASVWEVALWEVDLDGSGNFSALTDVREYIHTPLMVGADNYDKDSVDDTVVGDRVPQFYRRQGGSATIWETPGTTNYTPGPVRMQGGAIQLSFSAAPAALVIVTFPQAFAYEPLIYLSHDLDTKEFDVSWSNITTSQVQVNVDVTDGTNFTGTVIVHWLAIT